MERCGVGPCEGHGDLRADRDGVKLKEGGKGRAPRVSEDSAAGCVLEGQTQVSVPREGGQEAGGPRGDRGSSVPLSRYGYSPSKGGKELGAQHGDPPRPPGKNASSPFSCLFSIWFPLSCLFTSSPGRPPGMRESWGEGVGSGSGEAGSGLQGCRGPEPRTVAMSVLPRCTC